MLSRANQDFEAKRAAGEPPRKPPIQSGYALAKQLFPSSSSPPASSGRSIVDHFSNPPPRPPASSSTRPIGAVPNPTRADPLKRRSANIKAPSPHDDGKAIVSLCAGSDSFREVSEAVSFEDDIQLPKIKHTSYTASSSVYIGEDDFSDDEDLDLDFQAPSALPTLPSKKIEQPIQPRLPEYQGRRLPKDSDDAIPWSQSSPSHFHPPPRFQPAPRHLPAKRESPGDEPLPAAKKRALPPSWSKAEPRYVEEPEPYRAVTTPEAKADKQSLWDKSASTIKDEKRQLKYQQKSSAVSEKAGHSVEEIHEMLRSDGPAPKASAITLTTEQRHILDLVVNKGKSVFFTGPAGTGKSVLMRAIIRELKKKHIRDPERVAVTASTGLAACNIQGMTLHSFSGIGLGKDEASALLKRIRRNPKVKNRWLRTKTLVIDEISMVDGELFDKLSQIGRTIRNNGRPWGGIQLIITGDFFQLPPVPDGAKARDIKFAFEAATWNTSIDHTIGLTEVFRQKDPEFAHMLNEMRLGRISDQTVQSFRALSRELHFDDGLEVTELFPTRGEVDMSNQRRLNALTGPAYRYDAQDTGDPAIRERLLANMMAPPSLVLKTGAQVMLIKNMDDTLVNGSLGTVVDFMTESAFELMSGGVGAAAKEADPHSDFSKRVRAMTSALEKAPSNNSNQKFPLVQFHASDNSLRTLLLVSEEWKVELPTGEVQASRKQLPLILAWAISIHKAQGQTLPRVKVDLGKVFEKGQAYVALSRATSQQGLQVLRFDKHKVMAHPRVIEFYNKLYSAEAATKKRTVVYPPSKPPSLSTSTSTSFFKKHSDTGGGSVRRGATPQVIDIDADEEEAMATYA